MSVREVRIRHPHRDPHIRPLKQSPSGEKEADMKFFQNVAFSETDQLIEVAKMAEQLGFFGLATADHLITPATIIAVRSPGSPH